MIPLQCFSYMLSGTGYTPVPDMDEILFSMSMEQGAAWLKDTFSLENSEEEIIQELETRIQTFYFEEVKAKPGAEALLQKIKGLYSGFQFLYNLFF